MRSKKFNLKVKQICLTKNLKFKILIKVANEVVDCTVAEVIKKAHNISLRVRRLKLSNIAMALKFVNELVFYILAK